MAERMEKPFGHEADAINYRVVGVGAGLLAAVVIAIVLALHLVLTRVVIPNHAQSATRAARVPPAPRLQAHPQVDLAKFRARKDAELASYGWVDAQHAYARIPIARAMQLYVARGGAMPQSAAGAAARPRSAASAAPPEGP